MRTLMRWVAAATMLTLVPLFPHAEEKDASRYVTETVAISGMVGKSMTLDVAALSALPQTEIKDVPMRCSPEREKGTPSTYGGVLLRDLLDHAAIDVEEHHSRNRTYVAVSAGDGYSVVFSWHELFNGPTGEGVLVVLRKNQKPLEEDGRIGLISARDSFTCGRHVKWLNRIEVLRYPTGVKP